MVLFMSWASGLTRFDPEASALLLDTALIYRLHIVLGLTLFLITPFTRLVHVLSAPIWYLFRPGYQIVRSRSRKRPEEEVALAPAALAPAFSAERVPPVQSEPKR